MLKATGNNFDRCASWRLHVTKVARFASQAVGMVEDKRIALRCPVRVSDPKKYSADIRRSSVSLAGTYPGGQLRSTADLPQEPMLSS